MRWPLALCLAIVVPGCGRTFVFDTGLGSAGGTSSADGGDDAEVGGDDVEAGEVDVDTGGEGDTGGVVCPSQELWADFWVEIEPPPPPGANVACVIEDVFSEWEFSELGLRCRGPGGFDVWGWIALEHPYGAWVPVGPGQEVILQHHRDWPSEWFALHWPTPELGLIVGGLKAEWPYSPFGTVTWDPLRIDLFEDDCPLEEDACGVRGRLSVYAEYFGSATEVPPGTVGWVGEWDGYQVAVSQAHQYLELWCDDVPKQWIQGLLMMTPEG